jgi:hypothetical protein
VTHGGGTQTVTVNPGLGTQNVVVDTYFITSTGAYDLIIPGAATQSIGGVTVGVTSVTVTDATHMTVVFADPGNGSTADYEIVVVG